MDLSKIYGTIFPIELDDNNKYAEMKGEDIQCIQLTEPIISVEEIAISPEKGRTNPRAFPDRQAFRIPLVVINKFHINQTTLTGFCLDYSGFIPTVRIEFIDTKNQMLSTESIKDGSLIKIYIGGLGDEEYYKPIRQDFIVTEIKKIGGGLQNRGDILQYRVVGKLNVPIGYKNECWSNYECTSMQELFNLSVQLGLGFATNFDKEMTDKMKWQNAPNTNYFDFINDITSHSCYSPNTFFTSFIDQFYTLNFVECHCLLSHGGKKTDVPAIIYHNKQYNEDVFDDKGNRKAFKYKESDKNELGTKFNNNIQKLTYYYISNHEYFNGWTNFIEEYVEITNGGHSTTDGYRKNIGYSDLNPGEWGFKGVEFSIPPIDNLKRNAETQEIESFKMAPNNKEYVVDENTYIPINLIQLTQENYVREDTESTKTETEAPPTDIESAPITDTNPVTQNASVDDISGTESFAFYGDVDTTNMHKLYYFAKEQNDYQMNCMRKCGLRVKLQNYNPSIIKFSRIWVDIYDKHPISNNSIKKNNTRDNASELYKNHVKEHNDNIISFDGEGDINRDLLINTSNKTNVSTGNAVYNRGLSGWYVITEIKYVFDKDNLRINTILTLNRIEKRPLFKDEFNITAKGVEKYKEDNIIEKLIYCTDDPSYAQEVAAEEGNGEENGGEGKPAKPNTNYKPPSYREAGYTPGSSGGGGTPAVGGYNPSSDLSIEGELSKDYTWEDFYAKSSTCQARHIDNTPTPEIRQHIKELVTTIIQPFTDVWGRKLDITSGYRCKAFNDAINGSTTSAHLIGYAADTHGSPGKKYWKEYQDTLIEWVTKNKVPFDQIIIECPDSNGAAQWVHIGIRNLEGKQRRQLKKYVDGKYSTIKEPLW